MVACRLAQLLILLLLLTLSPRLLAWDLLPLPGNFGGNADDDWLVEVQGNLLHLRTGPGRGYPVLYSAEQGEALTVLKRRTRWVKLRNSAGATGWASMDALAEALSASLGALAVDNFSKRRGQFGFATGDFGGAATVSAWGSVGLGPYLALRATGTQVLGRYSDGLMATGDLLVRPFPNWRISPWVAIGGGVLRINPQTTLVQSDDRDNSLARAGAGIELYLTRRFVLHAEYMNTLLFTSRDDNEEIHSWQAGFSAFF